MRLKRIFILFFVVTGIPARLMQAQEIKGDASLEQDTILIGDQIGFNLSFTGPQDVVVDWPDFQDTLTSEIEIIKKSKIDSIVKDEDQLQLEQHITITSFDSGYYKVPPVKFAYRLPADTTDYYFITKENKLLVNTIQVDTTQAIKPIKGPIKAPYTFKELLPWILGLAGLIAIAVVLLYFFVWRKKEKTIPFLRPKPPLPPHIIALNELEKLKQKKLWQQGRIKEYHTELTDIVRMYIERRFGINAMEMISPEILEWLPRDEVDEALLGKLTQMFSLADMVKFAKEKPLPGDNDQSYKNAESFVEETIKRPDEAEKTVTEEESSDGTEKRKV
ncbi:MAG: hypothetical protein K9G67_09640 [Bacteroidales bacterium]|nr:hypothetical protein [Bacteroidales bacterium]MCF8344049.1 hypothetical protein [Bacteroidales bacterium]MCF8351139.1 hypothetical protein [Bacteroidales bacterium]MCF8376604.1 hypothetical protein [Bacteroidales bacterium]MCF8400674.1 hypothetical protein [Bacteroidales bacterium]